MQTSHEPIENCPMLLDGAHIERALWFRLLAADGAKWRRWIMVLHIAKTEERARLLRLGFGDAVGNGIGREELRIRTERMALRAQSLPRYRRHGPLLLDLLARDGAVYGQMLRLHPREFALLWRLAAQPGAALSAEVLRKDVWQMHFRPETNSLAVHIFRLRSKLAALGMANAILTTPEGHYQLFAPAQPPALPLGPAGLHEDYVIAYDPVDEPAHPIE